MRYLLALLVVSCATADRWVVKGPDGGPAVLVTCPGYELCIAEASEGCPFGYDVLDKSSRDSIAGYNGFISSSHREQMLIRCHRRGE